MTTLPTREDSETRIKDLAYRKGYFAGSKSASSALHAAMLWAQGRVGRDDTITALNEEICSLLEKARAEQNELIERCAKVCEDEHIEASGMQNIDRRTAYALANETRKLKV